MAFIQIIEYETDRADEIAELMSEMDTDGGDASGFVRLAVTQDRDDPRRYLTIVEFESYEIAMENSDKPETGEMAAKLAALCAGPPRFHNLDVVTSVP
jgi:quinol monooxygenase YgiN